MANWVSVQPSLGGHHLYLREMACVEWEGAPAQTSVLPQLTDLLLQPPPPPQELFSPLQLGLLLLSSSLYGAQEATEDPLTVLHSRLGTALVGDTEDVRGSLSVDFTGVPDSYSGLNLHLLLSLLLSLSWILCWIYGTPSVGKDTVPLNWTVRSGLPLLNAPAFQQAAHLSFSFQI